MKVDEVKKKPQKVLHEEIVIQFEASCLWMSGRLQSGKGIEG